jgi:molybdopterin synthase catalytic subunit
MPHGFDQGAWDRAKGEAIAILRERAARRQNQTITYTEFAESLTAIQIGAHDPRLSSFLEEIVVDEHGSNRPLITVLVVHKNGDLMPGEGFFEIAARLGFSVEEREAFWVAEFRRVTGFWRAGIA